MYCVKYTVYLDVGAGRVRRVQFGLYLLGDLYLQLPLVLKVVVILQNSVLILSQEIV